MRRQLATATATALLLVALPGCDVDDPGGDPGVGTDPGGVEVDVDR